MQRNHYSTTEELLNDPSFRNWILTGAETEEWEQWLITRPELVSRVEEARLFLLATGVQEESLSATELQQSLDETWEKIHEREQEPQLGNRSWNFWRWAGVAAAVLVVFGVAWLYRASLPTQIAEVLPTIFEKKNTLTEQVNTSNQQLLITLSDGSSVLLQPDSKLIYPKEFTGAERRVYLSGEGFFEVSKNPKKPFFVEANDVITKVVGTSFRIKAYASQPDVEVVVRTGKVNVSSSKSSENGATEEIVLSPKQAVRYSRQDFSFEKIKISKPETTVPGAPLPMEAFEFEFNDKPIAVILDVIEKAYSVSIDYPKEILKDCYLSSSLTDEPLPEKLKIICESLGQNTTFKMNGNQITIESDGCN
jgi:transmembrane sensor